MTLRFFFASAGLLAGATVFAASCVDNSDCTRTATCPVEGGGGAGAAASGGGPNGGGGNGASNGGGGSGQLSLGETCESPGNCESGQCTDGVCCAEACDSACAACSSEGACEPHVAGSDPEAGCNDGSCDGIGDCATGEHVWGQRYGDTANQWATAVAILSSGDVILGGRAPGTVNFGSGNITDGDLFVARVSATGQAVWGSKWGDSGSNTVTDIAIDAADNIYVTARTNGTITIGGTTFEDGTTTTFGYGNNGFLFKLNASGSVLWSAGFNDGLESSGAKIAVTDAGDIYLGGHYEGSPQVAGGPALPTSGNPGIFFAKLTTNGAHAWSMGFAGTSSITSDANFDVTTTSDGASFLADTTSAVNIGGQDVSGEFIARYDGNGNAVSANEITTTCGANGHHSTPSGELLVNCSNGVVLTSDGTTISTLYTPPLVGSSTAITGSTVDNDGNITLAGELQGESDFGGGPLTSAGNDDIVMVKLAPDGTHLWSRTYGDAGSQCQSGLFVNCRRQLATDKDGNVLLAGALTGEVSFGGAPLIVNGTVDAFLVKLSP